MARDDDSHDELSCDSEAKPSDLIPVCPQPRAWAEIGKKLLELSGAERFNSPGAPPTPLILSGWSGSSSEQKRARWIETTQWAADRGLSHLVEEIDSSEFHFMRELSTHDGHS